MLFLFLPVCRPAATDSSPGWNGKAWCEPPGPSQSRDQQFSRLSPCLLHGHAEYGGGFSSQHSAQREDIFSDSLVPRPHPLTRRNNLVNQVKFLELVHGFATLLTSNVQNILRQPPAQNRYIFDTLENYCVRKYCVIITDLAISLVLTTFGG